MIAVHLTACDVEAEYRRPFWSKGNAANIIIGPTFRAESDGWVAARVQHRSRFTTHLRMLDVLDNKHVPASGRGDELHADTAAEPTGAGGTRDASLRAAAAGADPGRAVVRPCHCQAPGSRRVRRCRAGAKEDRGLFRRLRHRRRGGGDPGPNGRLDGRGRQWRGWGWHRHDAGRAVPPGRRRRPRRRPVTHRRREPVPRRTPLPHRWSRRARPGRAAGDPPPRRGGAHPAAGGGIGLGHARA
jgi:hypothetical protein